MQNKDTQVILSSENVTPTELPILRNFKVWIMKLPQCNSNVTTILALNSQLPMRDRVFTTSNFPLRRHGEVRLRSTRYHSYLRTC